MKQHSDLFGTSGTKDSKSYWVKDDEVYDIREETDADFVIKNPEKFEMTTQDIQLLLDYCDEDAEQQLEANGHLLHIALSQGWIRIHRTAEQPIHWVISCDNPIAREKDVRKFLTWAIQSGIMDHQSVAVIYGFDVQENFQEYEWKTCFVGKYLEHDQNYDSQFGGCL